MDQLANKASESSFFKQIFILQSLSMDQLRLQWWDFSTQRRNNKHNQWRDINNRIMWVHPTNNLCVGTSHHNMHMYVGNDHPIVLCFSTMSGSYSFFWVSPSGLPGPYSLLGRSFRSAWTILLFGSILQVLNTGLPSLYFFEFQKLVCRTTFWVSEADLACTLLNKWGRGLSLDMSSTHWANCSLLTMTTLSSITGVPTP